MKGGEVGMTDTPYNMPPLGLFGKRCRILTGYDKRPFVYRIVNSELRSNTWCEPPITYQSEKNPVRHDYSVNVLIVVLDTLISENSRLIRVALKDVELMDEAPTVGGWISVKDRTPKHYDRVPVLIKYKGEDASDELHFSCLWYVHEPFSNGEKPHWERIGRIDYEVLYWFELPEPPKEAHQ